MYFPEDQELGVFVQHDTFLDKDLMPVSDLDPKHLPLNQNWSWDHILRSCFIKQADVLQGIYFFGDQFSKEEKQRNFRDFQQIIQNLLENAAKYSPADQPIHVTLTQEQRQMSLTVADFGIGIPDDKKALIFERFYRGKPVLSFAAAPHLVKTVPHLEPQVVKPLFPMDTQNSAHVFP